jgi:hypothetical protein
VLKSGLGTSYRTERIKHSEYSTNIFRLPVRNIFRDKRVPVTTAWHPQVADGGTASDMEGSLNILNNQSRTADRG